MSTKKDISVVGVLLAVVLLACGGTEETGTTTEGGKSGQGGTGGQGGVGGQSGTGGQGGSSTSGTGGAPMLPPQAFVRLAHLSPSTPAMDFCIDFGDGNFIGPMLKINGLSNGLSYLDVTASFPFPAGPFKFRPIDASKLDCSIPVDGGQDNALPTNPGQGYTFALTGQSQGGNVAFTTFVDDFVPVPDKVKLRFIHASPDTMNVDIGTDSGGMFQALFPNVAYGAEGMASGQTYLELAPSANTTLSIRSPGSSTDLLVAPSVDLQNGGALTSIFLVGNANGSPKPFQLYVCNDNGPKKNYTFTVCKAYP